MSFVTHEAEPLWKRLKKSGRPISAQVMLDLLGFFSPPIDVEAMCRVLGVNVVRVSQPGWAGAIQSQESPAIATIWVNSADARVRQRFTLAHELGHLMLHSTGTQFRDGPGVVIDSREREANQFAAELLMPEHMVLGRSGDAGRHAPTLARTFDVSADAMSWRLKNLGIG